MAALVCVCVGAAPPVPPYLYPQGTSGQLQQINPLDYYLQNNLYTHAQQKQGERIESGSPARLETLEPDSEVEYIPGAQPPQQPPQQPPVVPNLPGLLPGQRVFIVHMPVPGYSPGTIGGYQPVYVVAAAPQGNTGYTPNGYQNGVFLDPSRQTILSPALGYPQHGAGGLAQPVNPGLVFGTAPFTLNRPFNLLHQTPAAGFQQGPALQGGDAAQGTLRLAQLVALQAQEQTPTPGHLPGTRQSANSAPKPLSETSERLLAKQASEEPQRGERTSTHAHIRKP